MTSGNDLLTAKDVQVLKQRRRSEFWQICAMLSFSSLLISVYAIFLSQRLASSSVQHELDQASLAVANELGHISVPAGRFGNVGILDIQNKGANSQIGLNCLQATLRLDGKIAAEIDNKFMQQFVLSDALVASKVTKQLAWIERQFCKPGSKLLGKENFVQLVEKVISQHRTSGLLKSVKVSLGGLRQSKFGSGTPLPVLAQEQELPFAQGNLYHVNMNVPIAENRYYQFYELADAPTLVNSQDFCELQDQAVASVVLVEADFEVTDRGGHKHLQRFRSAALAGRPSSPRAGSVFMLSFPQGYFSGIRSLSDILQAHTFQSTGGQWYEAMNGDVPGGGRLAPAPGRSAHFTPDAAASEALYHFLFNAGPGVIPANFSSSLKLPIGLIEEKNKAVDIGFNSGLYRDTGLCDFLLKRQSNQRDLDKLLSSTFSNHRFSKSAPPYTFPLIVDANGGLNMPAEPGFDKPRIVGFLKALYQTNIAGIETAHIGHIVFERMRGLLSQSQKKIDLMYEELRSVNQSRDHLVNHSSGADFQKKDEQLKARAQDLIAALNEENSKQIYWMRTKSHALVVIQNGKEAAKASYEIASHLSTFTLRGLKKITSPMAAYLLNRQWVFIPHVHAVNEDELYSLDEESSAKALPSVRELKWTSNQFQVTCLPSNGMQVDNSPIDYYFKTAPQENPAKPIFVMLNSRDLCMPKIQSLYVCAQSPFDNKSITNEGLFYFAPQSIKSGAKQEVVWSTAARDFVYSYNADAGKALYSFNPRWSLDVGMNDDESPGLAAEFQVRTPIPAFDPEFPLVLIQDPDGGAAVALYPPLPAELI